MKHVVKFYIRVRDFAVVWWTVEGKTAVSSLDVVAGLGQRAVVGPCGALVNIYKTVRGREKGLIHFIQLSQRGTNQY